MSPELQQALRLPWVTGVLDWSPVCGGGVSSHARVPGLASHCVVAALRKADRARERGDLELAPLGHFRFRF